MACIMKLYMSRLIYLMINNNIRSISVNRPAIHRTDKVVMRYIHVHVDCPRGANNVLIYEYQSQTSLITMHWANICN